MTSAACGPYDILTSDRRKSNDVVLSRASWIPDVAQEVMGLSFFRIFFQV